MSSAQPHERVARGRGRRLDGPAALSAERYDLLVARLESGGALELDGEGQPVAESSPGSMGRSGYEKRRSVRHRYQCPAPAVFIVQAGRAEWEGYPAQTRNLSATGVAVFHSAFVHTGTACVLALRGADGPVRIDGVIRRCSYVGDGVHELGVEFAERIDPGPLLQAAAG